MDSEIDLFIPLKKIVKNKKRIFLISLTFGIIGFLIAVFSKPVYSSSTIFIPQAQESSRYSSLSGVANLIGMNIGSGFSNNEIPLLMYPEISNSPEFKRELLKIFIDKKKGIYLKDYLINQFNIKGDDKINNDEIYVSEIEEKIFDLLSKIINVNINPKDGFVTLSAEMHEAEYSARLANISREILQKIIINNKIESAKQTLDFSEKQLEEKRKEFNDIQYRLASFKDSNLNLVNSYILNEKDKLESEFQIISAVVIELSKQVEQAKLQVSKDTPVFSTIKRAVVPNYRERPKRTQIVLLLFSIGFIFSLVDIFFRETFIKIISEIKND